MASQLVAEPPNELAAAWRRHLAPDCETPACALEGASSCSVGCGRHRTDDIPVDGAAHVEVAPDELRLVQAELRRDPLDGTRGGLERRRATWLVRSVGAS